MRQLGDSRLHLRLLSQMGDAIGTDLVKAFESGKIDHDDWAEMVQACRSCSEPERCQRWLGTEDRTTGEPAGCRNRTLLKQLRDQMNESDGT